MDLLHWWLGWRQKHKIVAQLKSFQNSSFAVIGLLTRYQNWQGEVRADSAKRSRRAFWHHKRFQTSSTIPGIFGFACITTTLPNVIFEGSCLIPITYLGCSLSRSTSFLDANGVEGSEVYNVFACSKLSYPIASCARKPWRHYQDNWSGSHKWDRVFQSAWFIASNICHSIMLYHNSLLCNDVTP